MQVRRRWTTAAATIGLLGAFVVPAQAAAQAEVTDKTGDVSPEGNPPLMTGPQTRAIDIVRGNVAMGDDELAVQVTVAGKLADRRVSEESGTAVILWQGGTPNDPENIWIFGHFDSGPVYLALYKDPEAAGEFGFSESCGAWDSSEAGSSASYRIGYTCLPGADGSQPLHWAVTAGTTDDDTGDSWSDIAPDEDANGTPVTGPVVDFPAGANFDRPSPVARDITDTCDGRDPQTTFSDTNGNPHQGSIDCISHYGITQGTGGAAYSPTNPLSKGQTATFLVRTLKVAEVALAEPGDACDDAGTHAESLEILVASKVIVAPADRKCGEIDAITRAEMARWVRAALAVGGVQTTDVTDWYADDEGHADEGSINKITSLGIVTGAGGARFLPDTTLSRAQMATFLARTLDALFDTQAA